MKILALNPYHTGSHQAFLDGWARHSRHQWTLLTLPGSQWKWRMRHSAISFALQIQAHLKSIQETWDVIFTTDMLNLSELKGLLPKALQSCPTVLYFHENQFEYPTRLQGTQADRDEHFAFTNLVSAISADQVWFNSEYHRKNFLNHARRLFSCLPKLSSEDATRWHQELDRIQADAKIHSPGIEILDTFCFHAGPLKIAWVGRWEHDKNPDLFFASLRQLKSLGVDFQLTVLGESYRNAPRCFEDAQHEFSENIVHWGFAESRQRYFELLSHADVVVSTAIHEFFGIAILEAMSTGCIPVLPGRLSYPELIQDDSRFLYHGHIEHLVERLHQLAIKKRSSQEEFHSEQKHAVQLAQRYAWSITASAMDEEIKLLSKREFNDG